MLFEQATRGKYRFDTHVGPLSVEDLWDLPVKALDLAFKGLNALAKEIQEESLLDTRSAEDRVVENKIEIIRYIVGVKQQEAKERAEESENAANRKLAREALASRKIQDLQNLPAGELEAIASGRKKA